MYWKAAIVKHERDGIRVGILLFNTLSSEEKPVMYILGKLNGSGIKRKWMVPMKIKRWLLYDHHSCSYATRFLKKTIFINEFELMEIGERNKLWPFDKEIIKNKFPTMARDVFKETDKKKK